MQHRGVSLLEVLFSLLVLSLGTVGMGQLHRQLQAHADTARQRSEAVRLAHDEIEASRSLGSISPKSGSRTITDIAGQRFNTVFHLSREVDEANALLPSTTVAITWEGREGTTQQAVLVSAVSTQDPVLSGALTLVPSLRGALAGSASANALPPSAAHVDERRSAFKPTAAATIAFVVDDATAQVVEQCTGVPAEVASEDLRAEHLKQCVEFKALLLSGTVRFSNAEPPDPVAANDTPLELALSVGLPGMLAPASPWCSTEAQKTVIYRLADGVHREAVALDATAASRGVATWQDSGERCVAYRCVVVAAGDRVARPAVSLTVADGLWLRVGSGLPECVCEPVSVPLPRADTLALPDSRDVPEWEGEPEPVREREGVKVEDAERHWLTVLVAVAEGDPEPEMDAHSLGLEDALGALTVAAPLAVR
jgi:Tfp pilus assembly protein PilV